MFEQSLQTKVFRRRLICVRSDPPGSAPPAGSSDCAVCCCNSPAGLRQVAGEDCADTAESCSPAHSAACGRSPARDPRERSWKKENEHYSHLQMFRAGEFITCQHMIQHAFMLPFKHSICPPNATFLFNLHVGPKQHTVDRAGNAEIISLLEKWDDGHECALVKQYTKPAGLDRESLWTITITILVSRPLSVALDAQAC